MAFPSLYRAKVTGVAPNGAAMVLVPQVFGEAPVTVTEALGPKPTGMEMGWVFFQAGNPEFPVWASGLGTGEVVTPDVVIPNEVSIGPNDPFDTSELWYDTDAVAPLPAAANVTFTPTGTIAATNTQAAVAEVATDAAAALTAAIATATADVPWIRISTLGFSGGWVDYSPPYGPAYYRKKNGDVQLRGLISTGAAGLITTLPVGYRPQYEPIFVVDIQSGIAEVRVATTGTVTIAAIPGFTLMSSWTSLANVTFSTI